MKPPRQQKRPDPCERIEFDAIYVPPFLPLMQPPSLQLQIFRLKTKLAIAEGTIVDVLP